MGELAYEAHGVCQQEGEILYGNLPHRGVESGEELVFGEDIALAKQVHKGGFPHVGISHEGHAGEFAAVFTLEGFLAVDVA